MSIESTKSLKPVSSEPLWFSVAASIRTIDYESEEMKIGAKGFDGFVAA
jgi:hypothetical protein